MDDRKDAIQLLSDFDCRPSVAGVIPRGKQLQRSPAKLHCVVSRDFATVLEAEDLLQVQFERHRAVGASWLCCRNSQSFIVTR